MTFKSSHRTLATNIAVALLLNAGRMLAQSVPATLPVHRQPGGYVRLWNMLISAPATFELSTSVDPNAPALVTASTASLANNYLRVAPGHYSLRVVNSAAREAPVKVLDANIPDKGYYTVLVYRDSAGKTAVDLIDDTPDPKNPTNKLAVWQFVPETRAVVTGGGQRTAALEVGQTQILDNMPNGKLAVQLRATTAKGDRNWGVDVDFSASHRATVLVISDPYGRIRMRTTVDGPDRETEKEDREQTRN